MPLWTHHGKDIDSVRYGGFHSIYKQVSNFWVVGQQLHFFYWEVGQQLHFCSEQLFSSSVFFLRSWSTATFFFREVGQQLILLLRSWSACSSVSFTEKLVNSSVTFTEKLVGSSVSFNEKLVSSSVSFNEKLVSSSVHFTEKLVLYTRVGWLTIIVVHVLTITFDGKLPK